MVCQPLRLALLIGAITAVAVSPVYAHGFRAPRCCDPCGSSSSATAPATRTVTCTEWVKETYTTTRKSFKYECKTETYDTFKCERVPVCKERTVTCVKRVPVMKEETRKVCHKVTVMEDRVVNKTSVKYVQETVMVKTLVRSGHWETREAGNLLGGAGILGGGFGGGLGGRLHGCNDPCADPCKRGGRHACSDACKPASSCGNACGRTRQVWVHCPEYRDCPKTVCKKVCVTEQVKCKVPVCKQEWKEEKVKVCTYQCVEEKRVEKYTCWETRKVPCKATRTVRVCVPYEEKVTACRLVPKTVTKEVPCSGLRARLGHCNRGNDCAPAKACKSECRPACKSECRPAREPRCPRSNECRPAREPRCKNECRPAREPRCHNDCDGPSLLDRLRGLRCNADCNRPACK